MSVSVTARVSLHQQTPFKCQRDKLLRSQNWKEHVVHSPFLSLFAPPLHHSIVEVFRTTLCYPLGLGVLALPGITTIVGTRDHHYQHLAPSPTRTFIVRTGTTQVLLPYYLPLLLLLLLPLLSRRMAPCDKTRE